MHRIARVEAGRRGLFVFDHNERRPIRRRERRKLVSNYFATPCTPLSHEAEARKNARRHVYSVYTC